MGATASRYRTASALYPSPLPAKALVSMRKRLTKDEQSPAAVVPELEQLVTLCEGKLARIKPDLEDALKVARGA